MSIKSDPVYESIFKQRYSGAGNHRGVRYHALYSTCEAFGLYEQGGPEWMRSEALEDFDLFGDVWGQLHIQIKNEGRALDMGDLSKILHSFGQVLKAFPEARFRIVSSSAFPHKIAAFLANRKAHAVPDDLLRRATAACEDKDLGKELILRTEFLRLSEAELIQRIERGVIRHFGITANNPQLYARAVFSKMIEWAGARREFRLADVESIRSLVWEEISRGGENVAVRDGYAEEVFFTEDTFTGDYYDGVSARPAHIAAGLDVRRESELKQIGTALTEAQVCSIIASSGQGKSTLAYRHAHESSGAFASFVVRVCRNAEQASSIGEFIDNRLRLGIPITILIDNLGSDQSGWHLLARRFAGKAVKFVVTAREEDWGRYGHRTSGFIWRAVKPRLCLAEARRIFSILKERRKVAVSVPSGDWAFEKIKDSGLLIEFVYLVTKGRMLEDRLGEQIASIELEAPEKLEALKLVSVADRYGVRLTINELIRGAGFSGDGQRTLKSLDGEYIQVQGQQCRGLHPVRSQHLATQLHPYGLAGTVERLCSLLNEDALVQFVQSAFSDPQAMGSESVPVLVKRCVESNPEMFGRLWEACYKAEETRRVDEHKQVFDALVERLGHPGVMLFSMIAVPHGSDDLDELLDLFDEDTRAFFIDLRNELGPWIPKGRTDTQLTEGTLFRCLGEVGHICERMVPRLAYAAWVARLRPKLLTDVLHAADWQSLVWQLDLSELYWLLLAVQRTMPEEHAAWHKEHDRRLEGRFKFLTKSLSLRREGGTATVCFHVDLSSGAVATNEQAVERLKACRVLFPEHTSYETEPVYPLGDAAVMPFDDALKRIPAEKVHLPPDVFLNRSWVDATETLTKADGLWAWQDALDKALTEARQVCLSLLLNFERLVEGKPGLSRHTQSAMDAYLRWRKQSALLKKTPEGLNEEQGLRLSGPQDAWSSCMTTMLRNCMEENDGERSLKMAAWASAHAVKCVQPVHGALSLARRWSGLDEHWLHYEEDQAVLGRLRNVLGYAADTSKLGSKPAQESRDWHNNRNHSILDRVRASITKLPTDLLRRIRLPELVLDDVPESKVKEPPMRSLIIGIDVEDLDDSEYVVQGVLAAVAVAIPDFDGWLFAVPMLRDKRVGTLARRASCAKLALIAQGEMEPEPTILPLDLPAIPEGVMGRLEVWSPPENALIEAIAEPARKAAMAVALMHDAVVLLDVGDPDELALLKIWEASAAEEFAQTSPLWRSVLELREHQVPRECTVLWSTVIDNAERLIERLQHEPRAMFSSYLEIAEATEVFIDAHYLS